MNNTYYATRKMMSAMASTILEYDNDNVPLTKTELIKGMYPSNYAYALGILNVMQVIGYIAIAPNGDVRITRGGVEFLEELPF